MLAKVFSSATLGLDSVPIEVEVDVVSRGLPSFTIVGLADKAIEESKERVRSALKNSGCDFPQNRITVNLAPANLPKEGPSYDLPIALGLLLASGQIQADLSDSLVVGELSLDGSLRHIRGVLPFTLLARDRGFKRIFLPQINAAEAAIIDNIEIIPLENLISFCHHLTGTKKIFPHPVVEPQFSFEDTDYDFADIVGQEQAKRALEIVAAGGHNILMTGPPGSGKTLLSRALPSILPKLTMEETIEVSKIYSVSGLLTHEEPLVKKRPFRTPHHTTSTIGLIGGGTHPKPGEISLAHRGVLFLDELPEFPRSVLESLRQPLEDGHITVSRASGSINFPAKFILVAAQNPCPCGYYQHQDEQHFCRCLPGTIIRYQKRISGPLLDRIDLHLEVPAVKIEKFNQIKVLENSKNIRERVQKARDIQRKRFTENNTDLICNGEMTGRDIKNLCHLEKSGSDFLQTAAVQMRLSGRSYHRILKVSQTIADLAGQNEIQSQHIAEALQYRSQTN